MVEVISGPNVLWQLYRPPGITRAFRQKGHREHKTLGHTGHRGHFTDWVRKDLEEEVVGCTYIWGFSRSKLRFSLMMKRRVGGIFAHVWDLVWKSKLRFYPIMKRCCRLKCCGHSVQRRPLQWHRHLCTECSISLIPCNTDRQIPCSTVQYSTIQCT